MIKVEAPSMEAFEALCKIIQQLQMLVLELQSGQSEWVTLKEASRLSGRSVSWFEQRNRTDKFPISYMPRDKGNGRVFFSRADCIAFARKHAIRPPLYVELADNVAKLAQSRALFPLQPITSWLGLYKVS